MAGSAVDPDMACSYYPEDSDEQPLTVRAGDYNGMARDAKVRQYLGVRM